MTDIANDDNVQTIMKLLDDMESWAASDDEKRRMEASRFIVFGMEFKGDVSELCRNSNALVAYWKDGQLPPTLKVVK